MPTNNLKENIMKIVTKKIGDLIEAEYNPRQLTKEQFQQITDSIKRFGIVDPIIVNKNKERKNIIVGGHQRVKVAGSLGFKEIPCVEVDLTPDKERELNVRLNKNTGEWDWDELANHFDVSELIDWGFNDKDLAFFDKQGFLDAAQTGNIGSLSPQGRQAYGRFTRAGITDNVLEKFMNPSYKFYGNEAWLRSQAENNELFDE